jgi:eukaryotic-like serine/threonine-protein kinase
MTRNRQDDSSSAEPSVRDPWLGCVIGGRYRIDAWIGQGGMGVVYRGEHLELGKRVAIKRLDPQIVSDPVSFERFRNEAVTVSRIESPHVVHVFDWGKADDGSPYLVMELLEGRNLRELFQDEGRLLAEQAAAVAGQILRALMRTHQAQIIHRDLKPENVFLCRYDTDDLFVKLLDFGISKRTNAEPAQQNVTRRGVVVGTACYMSPEQARGDCALDARSDLYSVGAILYEALAGHVPHHGRTNEATLIDVCTRDADDVRLHAPLVREPLARVVARALQRDVTLRFQSAKEFFDALTAAVPEIGLHAIEAPPNRQGEPQPATPGSGTLPPSTSHAPRQPRSKLIGIVTLLLVVGATLSFMVGRQRITAQGAPIASMLQLHPMATPSPILRAVQSGPPFALNSAALPFSASAKAAIASSLGGNSGRTQQHQREWTSDPAKNRQNDPPGVASGLKLRRTMP